MLQEHLVVAFQYSERAYKKDGDKSFSRVCCDWTQGNVFKLKKGRFRLDTRKIFFYNEAGETLEDVSQRGGRCPIPGTFRVRLDRALSNLI